MYGDCAIDYSDVKRWVKRVKDSEEVGKASVVDLPRSGRPATPARWVPKQLTDGHKTARVDPCTEVLQEYQSDPTPPFCKGSLLEMKIGSIITSLNPKGGLWNGATHHRQEQKSSRQKGQQERSWLLCFGIQKD